MAGVFRFSNAVSDIDKLIQTFRALAGRFADLPADSHFDHNEAARFLAENGLASSLGAIGSEAVSRSFQAKTTALNPLFNQHKSYSEFFRMLGWYAPTSSQSKFHISNFGKLIGSGDLRPDAIRKLVEKCVLHIVSPNHLTNVKGGNILRPFPLILKLMHRLDGIMLRDEIILAVLACQDDRRPDIIDSQASLIKSLRNIGRQALDDAMMELRKANGGYHLKMVDGVRQRVFAPLGADTLPNYTRLPLALCKWLRWATEINIKGLYGPNSIHALRITPYGQELARSLIGMRDIRYEDFAGFDDTSKIAFTAYSNLYHLEVAFNCREAYEPAIPHVIDRAYPIFEHLGLRPFDDPFLFLGYQESPLAISNAADEFLDSF